MKEEFVSYECAKRLKECGFDLECDLAFCTRWRAKQPFLIPLCDALYAQRRFDDVIFFKAPSLSLAQKWLREVKGIHVLPRLENVNKPDYACIITQMRKECLRIIDNDKYFQNYESALSAGISSALNLLTEKKCQ